ncbi:MAG: mandelate racemase/muconate lactonizing enzyme family protein, partial [Planctomycetaceae bacterium]
MSASRTNRRQLLQAGAAFAAGALSDGSHSLRADDAAASAPKLKITAVKTFLVEHKLKRPFGVSVSVPLDKTRTALFVKIETDAGLVGWGETAPIAGARGTIEDQIGPALIGRSPLEHRKLWREIWGANFGNGLAVGAIDMALLDLRGKALNLPVAELFGGRLRDRVPAYASAMNYLEGIKPEDHYVNEAKGLVAKGYKALKMRLGRFPVAREAKVAAAVREAVGPDIRLMVDANAAYTLASALQMGTELHKLGFEAFEEPLPQAPNYAGYEVLREKLPLSLAGGEAVDSRGSAKTLIDRRAFDIINPDVSLCGGIGEALFIAELAAL